MSHDKIEHYLQRQGDLSTTPDAGVTAVEKFAYQHDFQQLPLGTRLYEDLIPKQTPGPGQQYAFLVDLDRCTGCKACVTACHSENGLSEDETWRSVGLLQGGSGSTATLQHVTTACHHCLEPGCLQGCPVDAYEKDAATGIVKHLDDQCFGCQYCTFMCPYEVPKFIPQKGIVHKCDMCISRLKVGEAPACSRACPNGAIKISLVDKAEIAATPQNYVNIPDAPDSRITLPTTRYVTTQKFSPDTVSADFYTLRPEHTHWPLIVLLVFTQLSVGAFGAESWLKAALAPQLSARFASFSALVALGAGLLALGVSVFHLGRPWLAFRAVLGFRHSWFSREVVAFGGFTFCATLYSLSQLRFPQNAALTDTLLWATHLLGLTGVGCSVMVYAVTGRPFWSRAMTAMKFFLSTAILGMTTTLLTSLAMIVIQGEVIIREFFGSLGSDLCFAIAWLLAVKMLLEAKVLIHAHDRDMTALKKTALLMRHVLGNVTKARLILGGLGGVVLAAALSKSGSQLPNGWLLASVMVLWLSVLAGEMCERYLFFRAVVPLKMPGATP